MKFATLSTTPQPPRTRASSRAPARLRVVGLERRRRARELAPVDVVELAPRSSGAASSMRDPRATSAAVGGRASEGPRSRVERLVTATLQIGREATAVAIVGAYLGAAAASLFGVYNLLPQLLVAGVVVGLVVGLVVALLGRQPRLMRAVACGARRLGVAELLHVVSSDVVRAMRRNVGQGAAAGAITTGLLGVGLLGALAGGPALAARLARQADAP